MTIPAAQSRTRPRRVAARERDRRALELRIEGHTFPEIGEALGVSKQAAHYAVGRALEATAKEIAEKAEVLRAQEVEKLDRAEQALWPAVLAGETRAHEVWLRNRTRHHALLGIELRPPPLEVGGTTVNLNLGSFGADPPGDVIDQASEDDHLQDGVRALEAGSDVAEAPGA